MTKNKQTSTSNTRGSYLSSDMAVQSESIAIVYGLNRWAMGLKSIVNTFLFHLYIIKHIHNQYIKKNFNSISILCT